MGINSSTAIMACDGIGKSLEILSKPSPWFSNQTIDPKFIVLHCIGFNNPEEILEQYHVSAHYLVPQQHSDVFQAYELVNPPLRAWHAGVSNWLNYSGLNDYSIGIETNMPNYARALDHLRDPNIPLDFNYFDSYQAQQMSVLSCLVKNLQEKFNIPPLNVIAHSDITPWRLNENRTVILGKTDPGATFPWRQFAQNGITVWPKETPIDNLNRSTAHIEGLLEEIGYQAPIDEASRNLTYKAAAYRFFPECYDSTNHSSDRCGELDDEFVTRLENMAKGNFIEPNYPGSTDSHKYLLIGLASAAVLMLAMMSAYYLYRRHNAKQDVGSELLPLNGGEGNSRGSCLSRCFGK